MPSVDPGAAESPLALAIDLGTSSVRALAVDRLGRTVRDSETQIPYPVEATPDGGVQFRDDIYNKDGLGPAPVAALQGEQDI